MTEFETDLLTLASNYPNKYEIVVDNDNIWLQRIAMDSYDECYVGGFNTYGYEFAYELLKHIGCNVRYC